MLVISRKAGESIHIGTDIILQVTAIKGGRIQIGITAPREVSIRRSELAVKQEPPHILALEYHESVA